MGYGTHDMEAIRLRLISNVSMLDAFNNAYVDSFQISVMQSAQLSIDARMRD